MPFLAAPVVVSPPRELSERMVDIQYRVRSIREQRGRRVSSDPMAAQPLPVVRLLVNATAIFLIVLAAGLVIAASAPQLLGYEPIVVISGSMEPAIRVADVVVTAPSDGTDLGEGAVINFAHEDAMRLHRIAAVTPDGYRTSGDANRVADTEIVAPSQVHGVGVVVVPFVGLPATWAQNGQWHWLAATGSVLAAAAYTSRARWVARRKDPLRP